VLIEEILLAVVVVLGRGEIRFGLAHVARRDADVGRVDDRERRALFDVFAERRVDARDAPVHGRDDVRDARVVEGDLAAREDRVVDVLLVDGRDRDLRVLDLRFGEPRLSGRRFGVVRRDRFASTTRRREQQHENERTHGQRAT
jgi:hypothetical protein